jgi:uncharacterized DUF497 family protein
MSGKTTFDWDELKNILNMNKHGVDFETAQRAFFDLDHIIIRDVEHSSEEQRFYCFGSVDDRILTVRFTIRDDVIRIFGAGFWRKGRKVYAQTNR